MKLLFWITRGLMMLFIAFLSLFALDVFSEGYGFFETIPALFMHLIPSIVLVIALVLSWKHSMRGGIIFFVLFVTMTVFFRIWNDLPMSLMIVAPPFLVSILFFIENSILKKSV